MKARNLLLPLTILAALAVTPAVAQDSGFFLEARGGSASIDEDPFDDTTTAFQFNAGYRWGGWGIEGGYVTFNDFEDDLFGQNVNAELDGWTLGINGKGNFADQWYLSGRLGAFFWDADANTVICESPVNCASVSADTDGTDFYAGVGIGYDFSPQWSAGIAYDYFGADGDNGIDTLDTNVFSATVELRF